MNRIEAHLCKLLFRKVLTTVCPSRIRRSGPEGERVNCFVVEINRAGRPYLLVNQMQTEILQCSEWDGNSYSTPVSVSLTEIEQRAITITHYYGLAQITYYGLYDLAIDRFIRWSYVKIFLARSFGNFDQYLFNRRPLVTKLRMDLLKILVDRHYIVEGSFTPMDLMTELYSIRWIEHPEREAHQRKLELYLDSLVTSGDLRRPNDEYMVVGQAIETLERYENEDGKHKEIAKIQKRIAWLTLAIAVFTAMQAQLIKFPVLLDLSGFRVWPWA